MTMTINSNSETATRFAEALRSEDTTEIAEAWNESMEAIADRIKSDYDELKETNDAAVLAQRGYRQLTSDETKWYQSLAEAARGTKQAFIDFTADTDKEWMPETIIEDVFKYLSEEHPLLSRIQFQYVGYTTKWILDDSAVQKGAWGEITVEITQEIKGALKVIDLSQNKYSAFCVIPLGIIDLGPTWMDAYIRAVLTDAISNGLEDAIINGTGVNMPCGLTRDPNSTFDATNGYEEKTAVDVTSFSPADFGELVAKLAKTENGKVRNFTEVQLICSMTDYLTKVMPATTILAADNSGYVRDLFPFPCEVIPSQEIEDGKAVLCLLDEYTLAAGGSANGAIEFDDSIGFLDHTRTFRSVNYFAGRAYDNTCAILLNIENLDPAYITVKNIETA